jgi:hypothetical protein
VEPNLAKGPAKLIKQFWRNFEQNSNSAGMVPGITRTELRQTRIRGICRVPNDIQIEHRQTPTLNLGVINKQQTLSPPPPPPSMTPTHRRFLTTVASSPPSLPHHRCLITTATSSSPSTQPASVHIRPQQPPDHERCGNATSLTEQVPATLTAYHDREGSRGHVAECNVASTRRMMTMSSFVVAVYGSTQR